MRSLLIATLWFVLLPTHAADAADPTYADGIAAIFHEKCADCHRPGQAGPFPLLTYDDVSKRVGTIQAVLEEDYMPPWPPAEGHGDFADVRSLTKEQKSQLMAWIAAGAQPGDLSKAPEPPEYETGWTLGPPDLVVQMKDSYSVPADGPDLYRSFVIPLDLNESKWVKAIELRPQSRSVVHHALYFVADSSDARRKDARDDEAGFNGMIFPIRERMGGYVPGSIPQFLPEDLAWKLPAHTDIVLQTHFHPTGKAETEQMTVGLYFTDKKPSREMHSIQVPPHFGRGAGIDISPGESDFTVTDSFELPVDVTGYLISGHAHYICKEMKMTATLPDGTVKPLLYIDDWNLDWQGQYTFREPLTLPAGTVLETTLVYDNSEENFRNPFSPPQRIRWGRESTDEMGSITLLATAEDDQTSTSLSRAYRLKGLETGRAIREEFADGSLFDRLDKNGDEELTKEEIPRPFHERVFGKMDSDGDGNVSRAEWDALRGE